VAVQLPGAGPAPAVGAPMFVIAHLELCVSGDLGLMDLIAVSAAKRV
jgi:hypothetical protein